MGRVIIAGGGGGADLDAITATAPDVLDGKVVLNGDGDPVAGSMPERAAWTGSVAMNGSIPVPEGRHNGGGRVDGPRVTQRGNLDKWMAVNESYNLPEGYYSGGQVRQSVAVQGADVAGTDRAWAIAMSNWPGTINLGVRNGHYLNGVNWIQTDVPNYRPENIKLGVDVGGIVGTWEGYVPRALDLYYRGNNAAGWVTKGSNTTVIFSAGQISTNPTATTPSSDLYANVNCVGRSFLNIELTLTSADMASNIVRISYDNQMGPQFKFTSIGYQTVSLDLATTQKSGTMWLQFVRLYATIYRIWLS